MTLIEHEENTMKILNQLMGNGTKLSLRFLLMYLVCYGLIIYLVMDMEMMTAVLIFTLVGVMQISTVVEAIDIYHQLTRNSDE